MKIIAHRGASFYAPENTMSAFNMAMDFGVDGLEMDVHMTKDNKIIVIHDKTTARTGNKSLKVSNSKFSSLRRLDVGEWFDYKYKGEKIPLLEDVINKVPEKFELYIEIKAGVEIIDVFFDLIKKYQHIKEKIVLFSFDYEVVSKLKKILPDFQIIWIVEYGYNVSIEKKMYLNVYNKIEAANLDGISTYADLSHCIRMAKDIIERKWIWNVWTVDNPCLAKQFKSFGVTSLSSNRPDWIIKHL